MARPKGAKDKRPRKKRQVWAVWYEGRRTAIVRDAGSRAEAVRVTRPLKRRGGDRVVAARVLTGTSLKQAEAGKWVRERAFPGDDSRLRGYGPLPKGFNKKHGRGYVKASDERSLVTFAKGGEPMMLGDVAEFAQGNVESYRRNGRIVKGYRRQPTAKTDGIGSKAARAVGSLPGNRAFRRVFLEPRRMKTNPEEFDYDQHKKHRAGAARSLASQGFSSEEIAQKLNRWEKGARRRDARSRRVNGLPRRSYP